MLVFVLSAAAWSAQPDVEPETVLYFSYPGDSIYQVDVGLKNPQKFVTTENGEHIQSFATRMVGERQETYAIIADMTTEPPGPSILCRVDANKLVTVGTFPATEKVTAICIDGNGSVWMSASEGYFYDGVWPPTAVDDLGGADFLLEHGGALFACIGDTFNVFSVEANGPLIKLKSRILSHQIQKWHGIALPKKMRPLAVYAAGNPAVNECELTMSWSDHSPAPVSQYYSWIVTCKLSDILLAGVEDRKVVPYYMSPEIKYQVRGVTRAPDPPNDVIMSVYGPPHLKILITRGAQLTVAGRPDQAQFVQWPEKRP